MSNDHSAAPTAIMAQEKTLTVARERASRARIGPGGCWCSSGFSVSSVLSSRVSSRAESDVVSVFELCCSSAEAGVGGS